MAQPSPRDGDLDERIVLAFRDRYRVDQGRGDLQPLSFYLAQFPEHEDLIAREYARLRKDESDASSGPFEVQSASRAEEDRLGPYKMVRELGRGGQGVVYLAEDSRLGRQVALKVLEGLGPEADRHLQRFRREAEVASKLDHPGVCGIHDVGIDGGIPYIAMRYVEGETLAAHIGRAKREEEASQAEESFVDFSLLDAEETTDADAPEGDAPSSSASSTSTRTSMTKSQLDEILRVFEQAARALDAAHESGIVHRDIKPGNIMVDRDGRPVILDFGLARDDSVDGGPTLTETGDLFGTPAYMSPEQVAGHRMQLDRRSDVYSLGVTLYECLTLKRPFDAPTRQALYRSILSDEPDRPRRLNRSISRDLEVVVETALRKERDRRYQSAAALADDLAAVRKNLPITAKPVGFFGRAVRFAKRRPAAAALLVALTLGLPTVAGLGGYILANRDEIRDQRRTRLVARFERLVARGFYQLHHAEVKGTERPKDIFEEARRLVPERPDAVGGIAVTWLARGRPEAALMLLRDSKVDDVALKRIEVVALERMGRTAEAAAIANEIVDAPQSPFGEYLSGQRQLAEAHRIGLDHPEGRAALRRSQRAFERAITLTPTARITHYLGYVHATSHLPPTDPPSPIIDGLLRNWPDEPLAWRLAGNACSNDPDLALTRFDRAQELDPDFSIDLNRVEPLLRKGRLIEALEAAQSATKQASELDLAYNNLAIVLVNLDRPEEALVAVEKALAEDPESAHPHGALAGALLCLKRLPEALEAAEEGVRRRPLALEPQVVLARVLTAMHRGPEAVKAWRRAHDLGGRALTHRRGLATALVMCHEYDEARSVLERLVNEGAADDTVWLTLSTIHLSTGDVNGAEVAVKKAIELDPDEPKHHVNLAGVLATRGDRIGSEAAARTALEYDPNSPDALGAVGRLLLQKGRTAEGIEYLEKALAGKPENVAFNMNLGIALIGQGERERGIRHLKRSSSKGNPRSLYALAGAQQRLGDTDASVESYRRLIAAAPNHAEAHCNLALLLRARDDYEQAIPLARRGHELGSRRPDWRNPSLTWLCEALEGGATTVTESNPAKAAEWWSELVELKPNDVGALRKLAEIRLDPRSPEEVRDPTDALALALRAVRASGRRDALSLDVLGRALGKSGITDAAIEVTEQVVEMADERHVPGLDIDQLEARLEEYEERWRKERGRDQ